MSETVQISKQIFTREGKVYDRWYQLYPALLHLYVTTIAVSSMLIIPPIATVNPITRSFGTSP
jgi:hypothetical protein